MFARIVCTMASAYYSRMLLSFLALAGLAVGKFARMLFSFLFRHLFLFVESLTGRDSIDADATVLFNLLWGNLGEVLWRNPGEVEKSESEKGMLFSFLFRP